MGLRPLSIIHWRFRFLVALPTVRDLLLRAKDLLFAANRTGDRLPAHAMPNSGGPPARTGETDFWPGAELGGGEAAARVRTPSQPAT